MNLNIKKNNLYLLYILGIIILASLVFIVGFEDVLKIVTKISPFHLFILFLVQILTIFLTGYIWYFLIKKSTAEKEISLSSVIGVHLAGNFVESVTPSVKLGGETAKVFLMRQKTSLSYQELTAITVVSKYFSLIPFLLISLFVVLYTFFTWDMPEIVYLSFLGLVFLLVLFILFFKLGTMKNISTSNLWNQSKTINPDQKSFKEKLLLKGHKIINFVKEASNISRELTKVTDRWQLIFIASIVWILYPVKVYFVSNALGFNNSFILIALATFTAYLVNMLPLLPGGLGSFEGSMALVFTSAGLTSAEGLSIALVTRLVTFWLPLLLSAGAASVLVYNKKNEVLKEKTKV